MKGRILIFTVVFAVLLGLGVFIYDFGPGTCPRCEVCQLDIKESLFIQKVEQFKMLNPQYSVPVSVDVHDGKSQSNRDHNKFYFYYPDDNQIIYTFSEYNFDYPDKKTDFIFVAVNDGLTLGNWKHINEDFSSAENVEQKRKFNERILNEILKN